LSRYIAHVRESEIEILPPDINESERDFAVVGGAIRFGFAGIKNVGAAAVELILESRNEAGPFTTLFDFAARLDSRKVNRRVVEALVKCGAFDSLHAERAMVWASVEAALERAASEQRDRAVGQENLFGALEADSAVAGPALSKAVPWSERERLGHEKELLGFYVSGHPLGEYAHLLSRFTDCTASGWESKLGREVRVGGLLVAMRETRTKRGKRMGFATLEDLEGNFELVIFSEAYEANAALLSRAKNGEGGEGPIPLLVSGTLEEADSAKILVRDIMPLAQAEEKLSGTLRVKMVERDINKDRLQALVKVLSNHPGDCPIVIHVLIPGESETTLSVGAVRGVRATPEMCRDVDALFGYKVTELSL
jgi:DNA polymerase-3 subunit alpha